MKNAPSIVGTLLLVLYFPAQVTSAIQAMHEQLANNSSEIELAILHHVNQSFDFHSLSTADGANSAGALRYLQRSLLKEDSASLSTEMQLLIETLSFAYEFHKEVTQAILTLEQRNTPIDTDTQLNAVRLTLELFNQLKVELKESRASEPEVNQKEKNEFLHRLSKAIRDLDSEQKIIELQGQIDASTNDLIGKFRSDLSAAHQSINSGVDQAVTTASLTSLANSVKQHQSNIKEKRIARVDAYSSTVYQSAIWLQEISPGAIESNHHTYTYAAPGDAIEIADPSATTRNTRSPESSKLAKPSPAAQRPKSPSEAFDEKFANATSLWNDKFTWCKSAGGTCNLDRKIPINVSSMKVRQENVGALYISIRPEEIDEERHQLRYKVHLTNRTPCEINISSTTLTHGSNVSTWDIGRTTVERASILISQEKVFYFSRTDRSPVQISVRGQAHRCEYGS